MPRRPALALALLLWLPLAVPALQAGAAPGWRAGTGRENITPPAGLWMTGYATRDRPADGKLQDLWVKALAVSDPAGNRGVLLTLDLCGIARETTDRVAAELERRHGLPRAAVMTNVSHTHCAPALEGNLRGIRRLPPDGRERSLAYLKELEGKMVQAAETALATLAPAKIGWGVDEATFGFNRRENSEKDVPALRAAGKLKGPFDPRVPVLAVRGADGALRALLVSYACHSTTLGIFQWHGDYGGVAQLELERRHPGATVLFAIGCGADINPAPRRELVHVEAHGRALADAADRALGRPLAPVEGRFAAAWTDVTLRFARQPTEAQLKEAEEKVQPNREMHQAWAASVRELQRTRGPRLLEYAYPVQAWRLGGLAWVALGGEVVVDYALRLRREAGDALWVFGYSNDVMAYIPNERVLREGRYEGETSMVPYGQPGPWAPGLEDQIVGAVHDLLGRTAAR